MDTLQEKLELILEIYPNYLNIYLCKRTNKENELLEKIYGLKNFLDINDIAEDEMLKKIKR